MREHDFIKILDPQGGFLLIYKGDLDKFILEEHVGFKRIVGRKPVVTIDLEASEEEFQKQLNFLAEKIREMEGI
ncbi:MAG TPA: hypothetical protein VNM22_17960 [Candidatus Limnocylindrales bacterium]|nr:hypothetical protein [Candidatus Limnocylindrales bacterium]